MSSVLGPREGTRFTGSHQVAGECRFGEENVRRDGCVPPPPGRHYVLTVKSLHLADSSTPALDAPRTFCST